MTDEFQENQSETLLSSHGRFFCPAEGVDRPYRSVDMAEPARKRFGLRLRPSAHVPTKVLCCSCRTSFDHGVLTLPTTSQMSDQLSAFLCLAAAEVVRTSGSNAELRSRAIALLEQRVPDFHEARLDADLAKPDPDRLVVLGARVAAFLTPIGIRSTVCTLAELVGSEPSGAESTRVLAELGDALGLGFADIREVLRATIGTASETSPPDVDLR